MAEFLHQLHFQIRLFLKILLDGSKSSSRRRKRKSSSSFSHQKSPLTSRWLWGLVAVSVMLLWNWQLLLATVAGSGVLILLFQFPLDRWSVYWEKWQQEINLSQRRLFMALGGSSVAGMGSYWAFNLWEQLENHWLAAGAIAQGVMITFLLGLQLSHWLTPPARIKDQRDRYATLQEHLSADHPLKRLTAVRELTQLAIQGKLQPEQLKQLSESFSLLFAVETEPMVRQGVLDSMQTLQLHRCWHNWETKKAQPLQKSPHAPTLFRGGI